MSFPGSGSPEQQMRPIPKRDIATTTSIRTSPNEEDSPTLVSATQTSRNLNTTRSLSLGSRDIDVDACQKLNAQKRGRPTVTKLASKPTRVIEISDTSDSEELEDSGQILGDKGGGRALDSECGGSSPDDEHEAQKPSELITLNNVQPHTMFSAPPSPSITKPSVPSVSTAVDLSSWSTECLSGPPTDISKGELDPVERQDGHVGSELAEVGRKCDDQFEALLVTLPNGVADTTHSTLLSSTDQFDTVHLTSPHPLPSSGGSVNGAKANTGGMIVRMHDTDREACISLHPDGHYKGDSVDEQKSVMGQDSMSNEAVGGDRGGRGWDYSHNLDGERLQASAASEEANAESFLGGGCLEQRSAGLEEWDADVMRRESSLMGVDTVSLDEIEDESDDSPTSDYPDELQSLLPCQGQKTIRRQRDWRNYPLDVLPDRSDSSSDYDARDASDFEPNGSEDPVMIAVMELHEAFPDVDSDHLLELLEKYLPIYGPSQIVEALVEEILQGVSSQGEANGRVVEPMVDGTGGSVKVDEQYLGTAEEEAIDYLSIERPYNGGGNYQTCAIEALQTSFPFIPLPYIREKLTEANGLYAPAHLKILDEEERVERAGGVGRLYVRRETEHAAKGKGIGDEAFEEEWRWLEAFLAFRAERIADPAVATATEAVALGDHDEEMEDDGTLVECGCCFTTYPLEQMTACPDGHLFCLECLQQFASTELGSRNCTLKCMHTSGCTSLFPEQKLRRLLSPKLFSLYQRLNQQKSLKDADIDDLEECPFCDWACIIEISKDEDPLFRCENEDECGVVSCRLCRKQNHLPKICREAGEDRHLDGRLAIEEAMTRALLRSCPKCKQEFIKSDGCNKMTCPNCETLSCYVCKKEIEGYDHFDREAVENQASSSQRKCPLYDSVDQRHDEEVKDAYWKALAEYERKLDEDGEYPDFVDESASDEHIGLIDEAGEEKDVFDEVGEGIYAFNEAGGSVDVVSVSGKDFDLPNVEFREDLENAIADAEVRVQQARDTLESALDQQSQARAIENSLQDRVKKLSAAKVARESADIEVQAAEQDARLARERLIDLRQQLGAHR